MLRIQKYFFRIHGSAIQKYGSARQISEPTGFKSHLRTVASRNSTGFFIQNYGSRSRRPINHGRVRTDPQHCHNRSNRWNRNITPIKAYPVCRTVNPVRIKRFTKGQAYLRSFHSAPRPPPSPLSRKQVVSLSQVFLCVAVSAY